MRKWLLLLALIVGCVGAHAQSLQGLTGFEFGADTYGASKYPNGYITLVGVQTGNTGWPYITADFHPTNVLGQFTYDVRAGVEQVLAKSSGGYQFIILGQAGIAQSAAVAGGIFSGGIGFISPPIKGWSLTVTGEGIGSSVTSSPTLALRVGLRHGF